MSLSLYKTQETKEDPQLTDTLMDLFRDKDKVVAWGQYFVLTHGKIPSQLKNVLKDREEGGTSRREFMADPPRYFSLGSERPVTTCFWLYGQPGSGKTSRVKDSFSTYSIPASGADFWDQYMGQEALLFDELSNPTEEYLNLILQVTQPQGRKGNHGRKNRSPTGLLHRYVFVCTVLPPWMEENTRRMSSGHLQSLARRFQFVQLIGEVDPMILTHQVTGVTVYLTHPLG